MDHEHWIVASTANNHNREVHFVDLSSIHNDTKKTITNLFKHTGTTGKLKIGLVQSQK